MRQPKDDEEFGPQAAAEFLRRYKLPKIPLAELTPKVCAAIYEISLRIHDAELKLEDTKGKLTAAKVQLEKVRDELAESEHQRHEQRDLIDTDPMTGLKNRRAFDEEIRRLLERRKRSNKYPPATIVLFDIDDFKSINSNHSHAAGDAVIRGVAQAIGRNVRKSDFVARLSEGADEYAVIMYNTPQRKAERSAENLREHVAEDTYAFKIPHTTQVLHIPATVTYGIHQVQAKDTPESILQSLSEDMHHNKLKRKGLDSPATAVRRGRDGKDEHHRR